jgi:Zn-dependent protease
VFIGEPPKTDYDLHFKCFGFPVRIHIYFWIAAVVLGAMRLKGVPSNMAGILLVSWIIAMFVSILIHELGHTFAMRYYGMGARIVLYMMGGLAIPDSFGFSTSSYGGGGKSNQSSSQIVISLAGPFAGFLLAGVVVAIIFSLGGSVSFVKSFPFFWSIQRVDSLGNGVNIFFSDMLYINIFWGLLNLLPIYPLDGGQVSRELFVAQDHSSGVEKSLWLSVFTAGAVAVWGLYRYSLNPQGGGMFTIFMFGSLAWSSYQAIQQMRGGGYGGGRQW